MRAARGVATIAVTLAVLAAACSSGDDRADSAAAEADEAAMCAAFDRYDEASQRLNPPEVFRLGTDELTDVLADRRQASRDIEASASGEVAEAAADLPDLGRVIDERVLDAWERDLDRLRAKGDGWLYEAIGPEVVDGDGVRYQTSDLFGRGGRFFELTYATCRAPDLLEGPTQDRSVAPPSGVISYVVMRGDDPGERRGITTTGRPARGPRLPDGVTGATFGDADRGRVTIAAHDGRQPVLLGGDRSLLEVVAEPDTDLICPSIAPGPDGTALASEASFSGDSRGIFSVAGDGTIEPLPTDLALAGCAGALDDGRLLVVPAAASLADPQQALVLDRSGEIAGDVDLPAHCSPVLGDVDEEQRRAALTLRCADPGDDGLWTVDLAALTATHVVTGLVAAPKFSPDGTWLTFAFAPLGTDLRSTGLAIWLAEADGSHPRELVPAPASFPLWLPAGAA